MAFILGALGWLAWPRTFNLARQYSRRHILFRGLDVDWHLGDHRHESVFVSHLHRMGCVVLGLLSSDLSIRLNLVAVAGYATLLVADGLAADGDTLPCFKRCSTQFWLATHVTCIGVRRRTSPVIRHCLHHSRRLHSVYDSAEGRDIYRMIYGTLCFRSSLVSLEQCYGLGPTIPGAF